VTGLGHEEQMPIQNDMRPAAPAARTDCIHGWPGGPGSGVRGSPGQLASSTHAAALSSRLRRKDPNPGCSHISVRGYICEGYPHTGQGSAGLDIPADPADSPGKGPPHRRVNRTVGIPTRQASEFAPDMPGISDNPAFHTPRRPAGRASPKRTKNRYRANPQSGALSHCFLSLKRCDYIQ
jgi:hypothetical protein